MFERVEKGKVVLVAVNRGEAKTVSLPGRLGIAPDNGLIEDARDANAGNYIAFEREAWTLRMNALSSLVVHR